MSDHFLPQFKHHLLSLGRAERTLNAYESDLRQFAAWFEQANQRPFTLKDFTAIDVREYRTALLRRKCAPATVNRALAALRTLGAWAVGTGALSVNPVNNIRSVETPTLAPKWLDRRAQSALLRELEREVNAARTEAARWQALRDKALVMLMLQAGLRVSEACSLALSDVALNERKGSVVVREGKGLKQRTTPLNSEARGVLREWLAVRPNWSHPSVFGGQRGEALQPRAVQRMLADHGRRAGVEVTPHTLRHSFAKNLIDAGVSMEKVAALLGHANLNTTRIYIAPGVEDLQEAVQAIG